MLSCLTTLSCNLSPVQSFNECDSVILPVIYRVAIICLIVLFKWRFDDTIFSWLYKTYTYIPCDRRPQKRKFMIIFFRSENLQRLNGNRHGMRVIAYNMRCDNNSNWRTDNYQLHFAVCVYMVNWLICVLIRRSRDVGLGSWVASRGGEGAALGSSRDMGVINVIFALWLVAYTESEFATEWFLINYYSNGNRRVTSFNNVGSGDRCCWVGEWISWTISGTQSVVPLRDSCPDTMPSDTKNALNIILFTIFVIFTSTL